MNRYWTRYLPTFLREKLAGHHELQNAIGNTGWLFADNILRMGFGFLIGVWVTRYLGPERFGQLNYAVSFVMLFSSISLLGLDVIVVRNLVKNPADRDKIVGTAFVLKFAGAIVASAFLIISVFLLRPTDLLTQTLIGITSLGLVFQAFGTIDFFFQAQLQAKYSAYARSIAFLASSFIKIVLILYQAPLVAFAWVGTGEIALGAIGMAIAYRSSGHHIKAWRSSIAMAKELLQDSWPLIFTDMVIMIYMRADKIMIGEIAGNDELGIYSVAALIAEALYFIPLCISSSLFPGIVKTKAESESLFEGRMQKFYNLMAFIAYGVAIPVSLLATWGVPLLFGPAYARAGPMLIGLIWATLFINLGFARSYYLTAMNWTRLHFITDFLGGLANVMLNLVLIPRYGGMGAVIASGVSYWIAVHGSCILFRPLHQTGRMLTKAIFCPKFW